MAKDKDDLPENQNADKGANSVIIAFMPDSASAEALAQDIDGAVSAEDMHLTLVSLGKADSVDFTKDELSQALKEFSSTAVAITGKVSGVGVFMNEDGDNDDVVYASFDSSELPEFRQELVTHLNERGFDLQTYHGFTPHITLAYTSTHETAIDAPLLEMTFDRLTMMWGDEDRKSVV